MRGGLKKNDWKIWENYCLVASMHTVCVMYNLHNTLRVHIMNEYPTYILQHNVCVITSAISNYNFISLRCS